ncbi:PREDICTED: NACHT, LRR and PYD domains-containing protein 12-like [Acropora digitifera]|uniref:NACHT, LRR and PYD domains-containing protein 12-like n=1 Tax=Acropora digitifera TaxID=70779 RepID=UPI00077AE743|nr:PREDICTED: NACHT, LRR and PYD domains-containing protein 12-like [Acropora digitifera]
MDPLKALCFFSEGEQNRQFKRRYIASAVDVNGQYLLLTSSSVIKDEDKKENLILKRFSRKNFGRYTVEASFFKKVGEFTLLKIKGTPQDDGGNWNICPLNVKLPSSENLKALTSPCAVGSFEFKFKCDGESGTIELISKKRIEETSIVGAPIIIKQSGQFSVIGVVGLTRDKQLCPCYLNKDIFEMMKPCERNTKEYPEDEQVSDPFSLEKCIAIIRQLYEDREGWLAPFPWCEEFRFNLDNIFTRLKFVSRRKEKGTKTDDVVDMFLIFQSHEECSKPRRVLIEGQPGIGKTTYCHKIAYDWAKKRKGGESFPDFMLVLLLKCRDINCGLWEAIDDQLLPREMNKEEKERFFTFIRNHQSKVLLVLDGLDELPSSQMSIYKEIIQGRVLPESYIVVTARHEFGVKVRDCCHTLLEVEGFTKTAAKEYIQRYFKEGEDLAAKLLGKLDSDTTLQDLTANPLNTALLCLLCEESGGKLPGRRTLLYLEMVECVLRRYRLKMKLPETDQDLIALYQDELKQLGCIAKEGLHNNSLYFDQSAFHGFSSDLISGLGLLSVEPGRSKRRPLRSYGFLHKSFQEFFAALYLCGQLLDGQISVDSLISECRCQLNGFEQVLMFTSGMLAQKCEATVKALMAGIATQVNLENCHLKAALACINECKREDNTFYKEVAHSFGSQLQLQRADCFELHKELAAVFIESIKANSTITALCLCGCGIDDVGPTKLGEQLKGNLTLTLLNLSNNSIGNVGADALANGLKKIQH